MAGAELQQPDLPSQLEDLGVVRTEHPDLVLQQPTKLFERLAGLTDQGPAGRLPQAAAQNPLAVRSVPVDKIDEKRAVAVHGAAEVAALEQVVRQIETEREHVRAVVAKGTTSPVHRRR